MSQKEGLKNPSAPEKQNPAVEEKVVLFVDLEGQKINALKDADKNETVPFKKGRQSEFLRVNKDSILENFFTNFARQYENPKQFKVLSIPVKMLDTAFKMLDKMFKVNPPENLLTFAANHEIKPEQMIRRDTDVKPEQKMENDQGKSYQYINEGMVNWKEIEEKLGISRDYLEKKGFLNDLLQGKKTNGTVTIKMDLGFAQFTGQARLQFRKNNMGEPRLDARGVKNMPTFEPYFGHIFSPEDKKNLQETKNMQRTTFLNGTNGEKVKAAIGLDPFTNEIIATRMEKVNIPQKMCGVELSSAEQEALANGKKVYVEGMISPRTGKEFDAHLQVNPDSGRIEMSFNNPNLFERKTLGGVELNAKQLEALQDGFAVKVEDMISKKGELYDRFVKINETNGQPEYFKYNPDSPAENREIIIPKYISGVKLDEDQREALTQGEAIWIAGMTKQNGDPMDKYIKLDLDNGDVRYANKIEHFEKSLDEFNEQKFQIPQGVWGHKFTTSEYSDLQNGKSVHIEGMVGYNGKTFDNWLKADMQTGHLKYYDKNPDEPRESHRNHISNDQSQKNEQSRGRGIA